METVIFGEFQTGIKRRIILTMKQVAARALGLFALLEGRGLPAVISP